MPPSTAIHSSQRLDLHSLAACVGIDWGDQRHEGCLAIPGSSECEHFSLQHSPEAIDEWALKLRDRFGGRHVAVCLEQSRGPLIFALLKFDFFILCPINPRQLASYRQVLFPSGAKDDPRDARLLLDFLLNHSPHLRVWNPESVPVRTLQGLVEERRKLIDRRTALINSLLAHLKHYFPQAIALLGGSLATALACRFLRKWPSLGKLQRTADQTLRQFFYAHNCRSESRLQQRLELIRAALPLTTDEAVLEIHQRGALADVAQIVSLLTPIRDIERRIEQLMKQLPEASLFQALPGAGTALAPRLVAVFGSDRSRWQSAEEIQAFTGVAPVTIRSGKSAYVSWRWACPKFLRQTFHEFARCSLRQSAWAKAFYDMKRGQKHSRHAALRALAYKWIRILFRCWQTGTPYDEERYLAALHRRNAPLLKYISLSAPTASPTTC